MAPELPRPGDLLLPDCARCGYPLREISAVPDARCPECGQPAERIPESGVFVCQPRTWSRERGSRQRSGAIEAAIICGIGGSVSALWTWRTRAAIAVAVGLLAAGSAALVFWLVLKPRPNSRRIVVDLNARRLRFERCWLQRHWGWPRSTGGGYECGFDELLGSELLRHALLITTPRGRIDVSHDWTCFDALARTVRNAAPLPPQGPLSRSHDRKLALFISTLMVLSVAVFLLGAIHNWW